MPSAGTSLPTLSSAPLMCSHWSPERKCLLPQPLPATLKLLDVGFSPSIHTKSAARDSGHAAKSATTTTRKRRSVMDSLLSDDWPGESKTSVILGLAGVPASEADSSGRSRSVGFHHDAKAD